jgi:hypothetical protein
VLRFDGLVDVDADGSEGLTLEIAFCRVAEWRERYLTYEIHQVLTSGILDRRVNERPEEVGSAGRRP